MHQKVIIREKTVFSCDNVRQHFIIFGGFCGICVLFCVFSLINGAVNLYLNFNLALHLNACVNVSDPLAKIVCGLIVAEFLFIIEFTLLCVILYMIIFIGKVIYNCIVPEKIIMDNNHHMEMIDSGDL